MKVFEVVCVLALLFCSCNGYPANIFRGKGVGTFTRARMDSARASAVDQENQVLYNDRRGMQKETQQDEARINQFSILRLTGGQDSCEGLLELQDSTGLFRQTCDLGFGNTEARVVCHDLGCNSQGAIRDPNPARFGFSSAVNFYVGLGLTCSGSESTILSCVFGPAVCVADSAAHAIAIDCGGDNTDQIRLVGGSNRCEGRLVTLLDGVYGQACDLNAGNSEAQVVCRELGCPVAEAQRADPLQYGFSDFIGIYHLLGADCSGSESTLAQCPGAGSNCAADSPPHAIAIECGSSLTDIQKFFQEN